MEKIIFSGRKLLQRTQTCPIGMISLFLVSYSALWIISSTKDHHSCGGQKLYHLYAEKYTFFVPKANKTLG